MLINSFEQALASEDPEASLVALVQQMKSEGSSQVEMYLLFEYFILLAQRAGREEERDPLSVVGAWVWGWGGQFFEHLLSDTEVESYRHNINKTSTEAGISDTAQLALFSKVG